MLYELEQSSSVPYGNTFLLVGGRCTATCDPDEYYSEILEYNVESETWTTRDESLEMGRALQGVVLVKDDIVDCV